MINVFIGVIGSGKDYRAAALEREGHVRIDFKEGLLDMVSDIAGYNVRQDYEWFKSAIVGVRRPSNRFQEAFLQTDMKLLMRENPDVMTGRRLLQRVGTDTMRKRDPDYWVKQFKIAARAVLSRGRMVVNADCRFPNEVRAIYEMESDVCFRFCDYRSARYDPVSSHESERMAQDLLRMGLKDGEEIKKHHFFDAEHGERGCTPNCGGCSCHINPPCSHCTGHVRYE